MNWKRNILWKVHVVCACCLSGFLACFPPCPSILSSGNQLQSYFIFLCLCPILPNEEDTVSSGNLLTYLTVLLHHISKIIMLLQAYWKINGLVKKGGPLLWSVQKCLERVHLELAGKQTLVIPGFMKALFSLMGISIYFTCCFF